MIVGRMELRNTKSWPYIKTFYWILVFGIAAVFYWLIFSTLF